MIHLHKNNSPLIISRWGRPKFQRGILCATAALISDIPGTVTISGIASINEAGAGNQEIRLRFNADGTIDLFRTSTGYVQQSASTDWVDPNAAASSAHDVRMASITAGAWTTAPAGTGAWINMGADREWILLDTDPSSFNFETVTGCVFEIRKGGGSALASTTLPTTGSWIANRTS